jgi:predicted dehydrogenase
VSRPMFFEVHRLGIFTPRSLDIDVVYDLMIHDLDILLSLVEGPVADLRAVGIPVITDKVDIAHVRLEFATGTVANLTASRVSTEQIRKMRFFQEHEYISLDFTRQDALRIRVQSGTPQPGIGFENLPTEPEEPLRAELRAFLQSVRTRKPPVVDGGAGRSALELADRVMASILEHARRVQLNALTPQTIR